MFLQFRTRRNFFTWRDGQTRAPSSFAGAKRRHGDHVRCLQTELPRCASDHGDGGRPAQVAQIRSRRSRLRRLASVLRVPPVVQNQPQRQTSQGLNVL